MGSDGKDSKESEAQHAREVERAAEREREKQREKEIKSFLDFSMKTKLPNYGKQAVPEPNQGEDFNAFIMYLILFICSQVHVVVASRPSNPRRLCNRISCDKD
jgi:hypothetical protein